MAGNSINPTTMWTPQGGYDQQWLKTGMSSNINNTPTAQPWLVTDPNTQMMVQDPKATATPTAFSNDAGTRGVMNPFGLVSNQPSAFAPPPPIDTSFGDARRAAAYQGMVQDASGNWVPGGGPSTQSMFAGMPQDFAPFGFGHTDPTGDARRAAAMGQLPAAPNSNNPYSWLQGVTSGNPLGGSNAANPFQFATPDTAARIAAMYGTTPHGSQLQGPGMGWSNPMQLFGPGMNAGLTARNLSRPEYQNGTPINIGQYFNDRDFYQNYGISYHDWATAQPGFKMNPLLANSGPGYNYISDGKGSFTNQPPQQGAQPNGAANTIAGGPTTTGGGSLNPTTPNIFLPPAVGGSAATGTGGTQAGAAGGGFSNPNQLISYLLGGGQLGPNGQLAPPPGFSGSPDQFLADYANNTGYLTNIAQNAGFATDATPAWTSMVAAQQRNLNRGYSDLAAKFAASGGRFSSDFGNAATDYWTQAGLNQNSLLGQMTLATQEAARGRELTAAGQLANQGFQGASQLSNQNFQALMNQGQFGFQAGQNDLNRQLQSALAFMQAGYGASGQIMQGGAQGAAALQQGALTGAQGLYGTETSAAQQEIQRQLLLQQLGIGAAGTAAQLWQSNFGLGNQIGTTQWQTQTAQQQAAYQEWLRTQSQNNPLLQMMYSAATGYPAMMQPQYAPSIWQSLLGSAGSILGGIDFSKMSDRRMKENIEFAEVRNGFNFYRFNYRGLPDQHLGVMADEIEQLHPEAVINLDGFKFVNYAALGLEMM